MKDSVDKFAIFSQILSKYVLVSVEKHHKLYCNAFIVWSKASLDLSTGAEKEQRSSFWGPMERDAMTSFVIFIEPVQTVNGLVEPSGMETVQGSRISNRWPGWPAGGVSV